MTDKMRQCIFGVLRILGKLIFWKMKEKAEKEGPDAPITKIYDELSSAHDKISGAIKKRSQSPKKNSKKSTETNK